MEPLSRLPVTPERWRQLTTVFHAARACEPGARATLLDRLCGQDTSLRAEVEGLLAAQAETSRLGDAPMPADILPQLSPGTMFGPYRVEALIGAGGMGQVYRATDPRLGRSVALKVLLPELSLDPEFGSRFEQEARVLASLNHPNIAAIHGLEESGGVHALVLEFVEGPTLAERIARGLLPTKEALTIARQIASALEVAHERGIVHRDLKPANVKITPAGAVKVLDFGIARVTSATDGTAPTSAATRTGLVIGTAAYMSPEQARGLAIDKRTDIWAFGCVLYEMLAGRGAFASDTASDSLAKVIERDPDWTKLRSDVPESIRRLITRCLQKDPANRLHDIADARIEISDALSPLERSVDAPRPVAWIRPTTVALGLAALALVIAAGWAIRHAVTPASGPPAGAQYLEFGITFPNNVIPAFGVALSPDGRYVAAGAFINSAQIWVHSFQSSETRALAGANGTGPFWSPDSSTIAYFSPGKLLAMAVAGGTVDHDRGGAALGLRRKLEYERHHALLRSRQGVPGASVRRRAGRGPAEWPGGNTDRHAISAGWPPFHRLRCATRRGPDPGGITRLGSGDTACRVGFSWRIRGTGPAALRPEHIADDAAARHDALHPDR